MEGQPLPSSVNVRLESNCAAKAPNVNLEEGTCTSVCRLAPAGLDVLVVTIPIASSSASPSLLQSILLIIATFLI
jgi:hypothetical protein